MIRLVMAMMSMRICIAGPSSIIIMSTTIETRHSPNETINTEHENRTIYFPTLDYAPVSENKNVWFYKECNSHVALIFGVLRSSGLNKHCFSVHKPSFFEFLVLCCLRNRLKWPQLPSLVGLLCSFARNLGGCGGAGAFINAEA